MVGHREPAGEGVEAHERGGQGALDGLDRGLRGFIAGASLEDVERLDDRMLRGVAVLEDVGRRRMRRSSKGREAAEQRI